MIEDKLPLYKIVLNDLKKKIENGDFHMNEPLPTQIDLARMYNTSEITSRRALMELVSEGFIYRVRGKGTFIRETEDNDRIRKKSINQIIMLYSPNIQTEYFNHPFYGNMIRGIQHTCEEHGLLFTTCSMDSYIEDHNAGYIIMSSGDESVEMELITHMKDSHLRLITVHFYYPHMAIPYVIVDNMTGGFLATQHLLAYGHRRIGIILTGKSLMDMNQEFSLRLEGYKLALNQHRIEFDTELVSVVNCPTEQEQSGKTGFYDLMKLDEPPTAIFATSDIKAFGVVKAAQESGMKIPADLSVVGYDDAFFGKYSNPSLTTVNQNTFNVGVRAVKLLLENANDHDKFQKDEIVPKLIVRDSTAVLSAPVSSSGNLRNG